MLINLFPTKLYSPEGGEPGADGAADGTPQVDETQDDDAIHQGDDDGKGKGTKDQTQDTTDEGDEAEDVLEIEGLEEADDGRFKYTIGNSVYISKEGLTGNRAITNVLKQQRDAEAKKDEAFLKMKAQTSKQKAEAAITIPKTLDNEDDEKAPQVAPLDRVIADTLKRNGLEAGMNTWGRTQWVEYQDKNELRDWEITDVKERVKSSVSDAEKVTETQFKSFNNFTAIRTARADVVNMLSEIDGVNPDDYAEEWANVLRRAGKDGLNSYGEISSGWIVREMGKAVAKTLNQRQKSQLREQIEKEVVENRQRRAGAKPLANTGSQLAKSGKKYATIAEATAAIIAEEQKRSKG